MMYILPARPVELADKSQPNRHQTPQTLFALILQELSPSWATVALAGIFLVGLIIAFFRFTLQPPNEPDVFIDPLNQKYGLDAHPDYGSSEERRSDR